MERLGLVGLPNSGKSSLFNALTGANAVVAAHPFSTTETTMGIAQVPDERLWQLAEMSESRKVVPAGVEFVDIAALAKGASTGEGLGNKFLGSLREVDALVYVLRAFEDPSVMTATGGDPDPADDLATLEFELVLADLAAVQGRIHRQGKAAKGDKSILARDRRPGEGPGRPRRGHPALPGPACRPTSGSCSSRRSCSPPSRILTVVNIGEDQLERRRQAGRALRGQTPWPCRVQLEAEAARLDAEERSELLEGLGPRGGRRAPGGRRRLPPPRPAHLPHHRATRRAGPGRSGPAPGPPNAPG